MEMLDFLDGDEAGYKSVTLQVNGLNAYGYLKSELFICCERSFWHCTTIPVGKCVILIADDVLLMCCPPAPLER